MNLTTIHGDLSFWDIFAPWYEKWLSRGSYHQPLIKELSSIIEPGWRVLDIGAATGVLSLPLSALGCTVEAVEPSEGMRRIFNKKLTGFGVRDIDISPERWESYQSPSLRPHRQATAAGAR
jgi:2-polyprenyl-3-methyl-5-hydroxy-6-metoxy-1,4-benzoquinol methylase